jgi:DNA topoisomerase-1
LRDGVRAAKAAHLEYARLDAPGWTRRRRGKTFTYHDQQHRHIHDAEALARIRALAIPPAWTNVWISPSPRAHIQATGRDARGRKQYRYHERFRALRDAAKYHHVLRFGQKLPALRRRLSHDSGRRGLERDKVLSAVIRILERTCIRVGNDRYAEDNGSFGVTTLRDRHARVRGTALDLDFKGKSGKRHRIHLDDARLSRIVRSCKDVPGQRLFQYFGADGVHHAITSGDVNDYLRRITGEPFSAKDFRTWSGTLLAINALAAIAPEQTLTARRREIKRAIATVSEELGNTIAVCRKSYIHPAVIDQYTTGQLETTYRKATRKAQRHPIRGLTKPETIALRWLEALPRLQNK